MTAAERELEEEATNFLRRQGYRADGRPSRSVDREQVVFERRTRPAPFRGRSTRK